MLQRRNYMIKSEELVQVIRSGFVDLVHHGSVTVADTEGKILYSVGDTERFAFMRSSAKPLQVIATAESGVLERYNISEQELAIMCASHAGEDIHVKTVKNILWKIGLSEELLQCSKEDAIRDNCSGKHSGMLTLCQFHGFPVENYLASEHPVQVMIREVVREMCDVEKVQYGIDGCGVPTFYLPLRNMAIGFARLASPDELSDTRKQAASRIVQAMQTYPQMTGEIRNGKTWPEEIVAKSGALGVYCGGIINKNTGIAVKIDDGSGLAAALVFTEVVRKLNLADRERLDEYQSLLSTVIRNRRNEVVGEMKIVF